ncbi:MAG: UDP-N-acetylglucosamine 1-carboxyvinyltransferase [Clostridiales bacterium]|jgi:UDP-N-acetylglucosamine 1-carboxyvinyltransferase|nr:UDP-N-acetylglucosamine 1-carboxyvinyltransferase [Clostridiales bacterium]
MLLFSGADKLNGEITVNGSKNAAMAIIAASLLVSGSITLANVPIIEDIRDLKEIVTGLGGTVRHGADHVMHINCDGLTGYTAVSDKVRSIRASSYLLGAMLGRCGRAVVAAPGGCRIGVRPLDYHIEAFRQMGADCELKDGIIRLDADGGRLRGADITLPFPSVGATINIMLAAVRATGVTVIRGCAREPHVTDAAGFLVEAGARINGAGTDIITVSGVERLALRKPYRIIPDQIEAGTYLIYTAIAGGEITLKDSEPEHLTTVIETLKDMGADIATYGKTVAIRVNGRLNAADIVTAPYPGFPTDLQQLMMALFAVSKGKSTIRETVFEQRFGTAEMLNRMGADITLDGDRAVIRGVDRLNGCEVDARALRGGAALIGAALSARGITAIEGEEHIYRGYEDICQKLGNIGAAASFGG